MAIELNIRKPLKAKIGRLDVSTASGIVADAEKANAMCKGWLQLLNGRLQSTKPLDIGARDVAARMAVELHDKASELAQQALALHYLFAADDERGNHEEFGCA